MQAKMNQRKTTTWSHLSGASNIGNKVEVDDLRSNSRKPSNKAEVDEIRFLRVHQQPYWY